MKQAGRPRPRQIPGSEWLVAPGATVLIGVAGLVTAGLIARMLGPADRGVLAGAVLWSGMVFTGLGLPAMQAVVVLWSRAASTDAQRRVMGAALVLIGASIAAGVPALWFLNRLALRVFDHPDIFLAAGIYLLSLPLALLAGTIGGVFLAAGEHHVFWGIRVLAAGVYLCVIVVVAVSDVGRNLLGCVAAMAAGAVVSAAWAVARFRTSYPLLPRWHWPSVRDLALFSARSNAAGLPYQLNVRFDQALLALLVPAVVLGHYVVAFAWSSVVMLLGSGVSTVVLAHSAAVGAHQEPASVARLFARLRLVLLGVVALGAGAALLAPLVVPVLFGAEFRSAVVPAVLLCVAAVILTMTLSLHEVARGFGHPDVGIVAELAALPVAVAVLLVLVAPLGGTGAALASIAGYSTALILLAARLNRRMGGVLLPALLPTKADFAPVVRRFPRLRGSAPRAGARVDYVPREP